MYQQSSGPHLEGPSSVKDKPAPPLRRSCEACRASKGRCCPSKDDTSRCQRCLRDGRQCVFLEAKPRPKRVRTSRTRVAEMEQKLDGIFAMLSANNPKTSKDDTFLPDIAYPTPPAGSDRNETVVEKTYDVQALTPMPPLSPPWLNLNEPQDVIRKGIVSYEKAETLLRSYGTHASNFPFIILSSSVSLDSFRREKPFLLLSILTITSHANQVLQDTLEAELRETLGRKVIFNGETSLDLMQGLLLYLAWYYQFFTPARQQIYQLSQLVIAMAVDLDISRSGNNFSSTDSAFIFGNDQDYNVHENRFPSELEAMRTFLGCYYLSSYLSIAFRKPNNMKYTQYMDTCCQTLANEMETPSDSLLPYFIRLQRLAEEICITFDYGSYQDLPELDAMRIDMFAKTFRKQLKEIEESFPSDAWQNDAIRLGFLHVNVYVNEICLHATKPEPVNSIADIQSSRHEWYYSAARNDALIACIESSKKYIDDYLKLPKETMFQNTIAEEMRLIYAIFMLGRFTTGVDSPFLEASYLRDTAQFNQYTSALIERLSGVITRNENGRERINYFWNLKRILEYAKGWFEAQVQCGIYTTLGAKGLPDCLDFSFMDILDPESEPDTTTEAETEPSDTVPASNDHLWTVAMLEAWPTSTLDPRDISLDGCFQ